MIDRQYGKIMKFSVMEPQDSVLIKCSGVSFVYNIGMQKYIIF